MAVDGDGNIFVTGFFGLNGGTVDFGDGLARSSDGDRDIFLAAYLPSGTNRWSKKIGGTGADEAKGIAVDGQGNIYITGSFEEIATFDGQRLRSEGGTDIFIAKYKDNGTSADYLWANRYGDVKNQQASGIALDGDDNWVVSGEFKGNINFGGQLLSADNGSNSNSPAIFLAKFTRDSHLWSQAFVQPAGLADLHCSAPALDPSGAITITGLIASPVNFGAGPLLGTAGSGYDAFLVRFAPSGVTLWSKRFSGPNEENGNTLCADSAGNVFCAGYFNETLDLGGRMLTTRGGQASFLGKFGP